MVGSPIRGPGFLARPRAYLRLGRHAEGSAGRFRQGPCQAKEADDAGQEEAFLGTSPGPVCSGRGRGESCARGGQLTKNFNKAVSFRL